MPLLSALRFVLPVLRAPGASLRVPVGALLPHFGSTAVTGVSLYAFRALLVLVAGRAVAGDLFAAFAVGSFLGTLFANVLGPSFSLHEQRSGKAYLPKWMWTAILAYLAAGAALLAVGYLSPGVLEGTGKSAFFWRALGWSLLGGVVMVAAQRGRLRLLAPGRGDAVFGPDVMIHVLLIAAVPVLYATDRSYAWAALYFLNAILALVFYAASERSLADRFGPLGDKLTVALLAFLVFLPLFVLLSGQVYNPAHAVYDTGGVLSNLPLPVSLFACFGGVLLLGRYRSAGPALWTIVAMLVMMMLSSALVAGSSVAERSKMLLMLQILLPTFGLVLGAAIDPERLREREIGLAVLAAVALIVPAQLITTWIDGSRTLRHSVVVFGIYQHLQFVPVILTCGYLAVLPMLWQRWGAIGRCLLTILLALVGVYAVAAHSVLAMFAAVAGSLFFGAWLFVRRERLAMVLGLLVVLGSFAGYFRVAMETDAFRNKFSFVFSKDDQWVSVHEYSIGTKPKFWGGWDIVGLPADMHPGGGYLFRFGLTEHARKATLVVEGDLEEGEIGFLIDYPQARIVTEVASVKRPGPFRVEIAIDKDRGDFSVLAQQPPGPVRGRIRTLRWLYPAENARDQALRSEVKPTAPSAVPAVESAAMPPDAVRNVVERISDWNLFGRGILESYRSALFGHRIPLAREQRTSAHNFYIDFAYNFGLLALMPLLLLIGYTIVRLWRRRGAVLDSPPLFALAAAVLFLVLVECNLKVSLRQPYPGMAIFFLWGLLLARLRAPGREKSADVTDRLHSASA